MSPPAPPERGPRLERCGWSGTRRSPHGSVGGRSAPPARASSRRDRTRSWRRRCVPSSASAGSQHPRTPDWDRRHPAGSHGADPAARPAWSTAGAYRPSRPPRACGSRPRRSPPCSRPPRARCVRQAAPTAARRFAAGCSNPPRSPPGHGRRWWTRCWSTWTAVRSAPGLPTTGPSSCGVWRSAPSSPTIRTRPRQQSTLPWSRITSAGAAPAVAVWWTSRPRRPP